MQFKHLELSMEDEGGYLQSWDWQVIYLRPDVPSGDL